MYLFYIGLVIFLVCMIMLMIANREPTLKFYLSSQRIKMPTKRDEDVGYDIYPFFDEDSIIIAPHTTVLIPTGLYSVIPKGYYVQLKERSSIGSKTVIQQAGVIDSGYRGEWKVPVTNGGNKPLVIAKNPFYYDPEETTVLSYETAICQAVLEKMNYAKVKRINRTEFKKCCNTQRGEGGFGSSGK